MISSLANITYKGGYLNDETETRVNEAAQTSSDDIESGSDYQLVSSRNSSHPDNVVLRDILKPEAVPVPGTSIVTENPFMTKTKGPARMWLATIPADKAKELLKPYRLHPLLMGEKALLAVMGISYEDTSSGPYNETVMMIPATHDESQSKLGLSDIGKFLRYFKRPEELTKEGILALPDTPYVFAATDLFLNKEEPITVGRRLMSFPKHPATVDYQTRGRSEQRLAVTSPEGQPLIRAEGHSKLRISPRTGPLGLFKAYWMRFPVEAMLVDEGQTSTQLIKGALNATMGLDLFPGNDRLNLYGRLKDRYGDPRLMAGLLFYEDCEAAAAY